MGHWVGPSCKLAASRLVRLLNTSPPHLPNLDRMHYLVALTQIFCPPARFLFSCSVAAGKIWKLGGLSFKGGKYDVSACPSADTRINNSAGADIPHYYRTPIKTTIKYQASKLNIQDSTHSSAVKYPKLNSLKMAHLHRTLSFKRITGDIAHVCLDSVFVWIFIRLFVGWVWDKWCDDLRPQCGNLSVLD